MNTAKNIHFTILVRINKRLHEFNFRKRSEELYDGDTGDDRGNRYYFKMTKADNTWRIEGRDLPKWISENENLITDALSGKENV